MSVRSNLDFYNLSQKIAVVFAEKLNEIAAYIAKDMYKPEYTISDFKDYQPYVIFNENTSSGKVFILPPGEGGAESYINTLLPKLNSKQVVLFNNYYLHLNSQKDIPDALSKITYERLAKEYLCYVKSIQPHGPYELLGWSFGGNLAFEMARQLLASGEKVSKLIIIDSLFKWREMSDKFNYKIPVFSEYQQLFSEYQKQIQVDDHNFKLFYLKAANHNLLKRSLDKKDHDLASNVMKHYIESKANFIDEVAIVPNLKVFHMKHDHFSWIKDREQLEFIAKLLENER